MRTSRSLFLRAAIPSLFCFSVGVMGCSPDGVYASTAGTQPIETGETGESGASDSSDGPGSTEAGDGGGEVVADGFAGQELYRGLFFGVGPAAETIQPILRTDDTQQLANQVDLVDPELRRTILLDAAEQLEADGEDALADQVRTAVEIWDTAEMGETPPEFFAEEVLEWLVEVVAEGDPTFLDRFADDLQSGNPLRVEAGVIEGREKTLNALHLLVGDTAGAVPLNGNKKKKPPGHGVDQDSSVGASVAVLLVVVVVVVVVVLAPVLSDPMTPAAVLFDPELADHTQKKIVAELTAALEIDA